VAYFGTQARFSLTGEAARFRAIAVLTIALGVAANAAIFSVVDAVMLRSTGRPSGHVAPDHVVGRRITERVGGSEQIEHSGLRRTGILEERQKVEEAQQADAAEVVMAGRRPAA
jgi:hypothetical protein